MISAPHGGPQNAFFILVQIPYHPLCVEQQHEVQSLLQDGELRKFSVLPSHHTSCVSVYFACYFISCSHLVEISCSLHRNESF